jgi:TPR repeat protein
MSAAVNAYRQAANAGSGPAARRLYEIYTKGEGSVGKDSSEANAWRNKATQLGENMPEAVRLR